ncbi:MAG: M55 family metallopeptidase, partial [Planctomycetota bacterium]
AVTSEQLGPGGFEDERFRKFMTDEVNAAISGAKAAGATEILVSDSHGNGQNLLIELLPDDVKVIRSWPRPLMMMEGIDASFDGAIFIGYHTATTNSKGVRAHTMSSANITGLHLNGVPMSEAGINAAIAGHFDVPIIMISGDDAVVDETSELLGDVESAVVKNAISFHAAENLHPRIAQNLIDERSRSAIARISDFKPYKPQAPFQIDLSLKHYQPAELLAYLPNVDRIDSHTIRFVGKDMIEVSKFLEFVIKYRIDLQP